MKVVHPSPLLREAAEVLAPVRDDVVLVGAAALEIALYGKTATVTPTRDVDIVVSVDQAAEVIRHLLDAALEPSTEAHERGFTWVRGDLKVQLVRGFHPFPKPPAARLPGNPVFGMASRANHQVAVAFTEAPTVTRLRCVQAACLLALKQAAFGRTRGPDALPADRDYHDAFLLIDLVPEDIVAGGAIAEYEVRARISAAIDALQAGETATIAAARQMVLIGAAETQRRAEEAVHRAARRLRARFELS